MRRAAHNALGLGLTAMCAVSPCSGGDLKDLHFGEAVYYAHQGQYLEALERLDAELGQYRDLDEPQLDTLHFHVGEAEFSVGDFELNYRMHHRAGRAIKAVLEGAVDEAVRNEAAFRLARIHFQKDQLEEALHALDRMQGRVPDPIKDEVEFLRANVYLASGRPEDAASVLQRLQGADGLTGFAEYNLGIALLQGQRADAALEQLDKAGKIQARDEAVRSIKDKSNLILGDLLFESNRFDRAQLSFDRVRLEGPFSNQALLRSGWAAMSAEQYDRAIVPWSRLVERDVTDGAVQEALLALPYAYGKLNINGRAALMYGRALETFSKEGERVDASIRSIREGKFLKALVREEIRQDKDWVIRLRTLPDTPETYYLASLMSSHDFQTSLQNYLDLEDVRKKLETWQRSFAAFEDIIELRRRNYEPLLPEVDAKFRELDSQIRLRQEQRKNIEKRLHGMLTAPRPDYLATADERIVHERLNQIERALETMPEAQTEHQRRRVARLQGVLTWHLNTQYHERLTEAYEHLEQLNSDIAKMTAQYQAFVRARQAATHSYVGYDDSIKRLRRRVSESLQQVTLVMARQGRVLEMVAINELGIRRDRLESYESQARYAVADSYDRATRAQANAGGQN
ncbi:MAG TPA: tetratricopeptide repeat protein [Steroidobacter sp.]|uniref:tetratricopeptide repeat protein n=1 Tax=Steroidobacter sp. TaxID=1978227 RepID=UPI002EDA8C0C